MMPARSAGTVMVLVPGETDNPCGITVNGMAGQVGRMKGDGWTLASTACHDGRNTITITPRDGAEEAPAPTAVYVRIKTPPRRARVVINHDRIEPRAVLDVPYPTLVDGDVRTQRVWEK
jgi:hypothetical protein